MPQSSPEVNRNKAAVALPEKHAISSAEHALPTKNQAVGVSATVDSSTPAVGWTVAVTEAVAVAAAEAEAEAGLGPEAW